jgi:hypothetical protein
MSQEQHAESLAQRREQYHAMSQEQHAESLAQRLEQYAAMSQERCEALNGRRRQQRADQHAQMEAQHQSVEQRAAGIAAAAGEGVLITTLVACCMLASGCAWLALLQELRRKRQDTAQSLSGSSRGRLGQPKLRALRADPQSPVYHWWRTVARGPTFVCTACGALLYQRGSRPRVLLFF